jgi:hypothetical protein
MSDSETPVLSGVPASAFGSPVSDLLAADPPPAIRSAFTDLLDQALEAPQSSRTRVERWVDDPPGPLGPRGHWEVVT